MHTKRGLRTIQFQSETLPRRLLPAAAKQLQAHRHVKKPPGEGRLRLMTMMLLLAGTAQVFLQG
jgi:hypothetical protein